MDCGPAIMASNEFRAFLSAVTSEFGKARDELANDLGARDLKLRVQRSFRQEATSDTLLKKLHDYIKDCSAVVCVIGKRSGAFPTPDETLPFAHLLPNGIDCASYTEWEFFFARHYGRRLSLYLAKDGYAPDEKNPRAGDDLTLQSAFVKHIESAGLDRNYFVDVHELCRLVLKEDWPKKKAAKPIMLPYPTLGSLFKGREDFLKHLRESLTKPGGGRTAIIHKAHALYGLGGIGKTRAAVEYAWAHQDDYNALLFVIGETPEALKRNLTALVGSLVGNLDNTDDAQKLRAVLDWLKNNPGWLLILDNLDSKEAIAEAEALLGKLAGGHIVITSRLSNFSAHVEPLVLGVLALDEAAAFLMERTANRRRVAADESAVARAVAFDLGQLALALEQAGAYIAKHRLTFAQYHEQWRANCDKLIAWWDETVTGYPRTVAVTWETSVTQLSPGGHRLLERLAWLAPEPIPEFLLDVAIPRPAGNRPGWFGVVLALVRRLGRRAKVKESLFDASAELASYSLVTRDAERPFLLVHRMVQDVTRRSLGDDKARLGEALNWVNAAFAGNAEDVRDWPALEPLAPHARAVAAFADTAGIPHPTVRLMNDVAVLLKEKALYAEAELLYRRALAICEKSFGPDHPNLATSLINLAQLLQRTNRLAEAEPFIQRVISMSEKVERDTGNIDFNFAVALSSFARLLNATNRRAEAEPLLRRVLAIDEKNFHPDHPKIAIRLSDLSSLLQATGRLGEAEPLVRRALAINEKSFGPEHPRVAILLSNLGALLDEANRPAEAEPLIRRALAINEKSLGPDHPDVATSLNNLGTLLHATNRFTEAEPLVRRALAINEKSFGPEHPQVAIALNNLALLLRATNRLAEAEPLMRRHVVIFVEFTRGSGHEHPHLQAALQNYSGLLRAMGRSETKIKASIKELMRPLR
jgi:tetratricopeptide (TPR) repeat protein